jgi:hypothetical protein
MPSADHPARELWLEKRFFARYPARNPSMVAAIAKKVDCSAPLH